MRGRGIYWIADRPEMNNPLVEILDHLQHMADGPGQPIEAGDDEDVSRGEFSQQFCQHWASVRCPGTVLLIDAIAAGRPQLAQLGGQETRDSRQAFAEVGLEWISFRHCASRYPPGDDLIKMREK
ncbi:hypothetical protein N185_17285 [Sinorhizobium sp. GW3]|nr:hypothetical protein N185_17285 [Sinorhizobium sp. GW3]